MHKNFVEVFKVLHAFIYLLACNLCNVQIKFFFSFSTILEMQYRNIINYVFILVALLLFLWYVVLSPALIDA